MEKINQERGAMNKKIFFLIGAVCLNIVYATDDSERGVPSSPLTIWSAGIGAGGVVALNDELRAQSEQLLKLSFLNSIYITDRVNLFCDLDWFGPGSNFGADLGADFLLMDGRFRPFLGLGAGAHYFEKNGNNFGRNFGPSITAHIGFVLDVTERVHVQVRLPVYLVANTTRDQAAGVEIGMLFSRPYRYVKKLKY
jgi:hypothetical protein